MRTMISIIASELKYKFAYCLMRYLYGTTTNSIKYKEIQAFVALEKL